MMSRQPTKITVIAITDDLVIASRLKKSQPITNVNAGVVAISGDTTTTSPRCRAVFRLTRPMPFKTPHKPNQK